MKDYNLLADPTLTAKDLALIYDKTPVTIHRWRKSLGITMPKGSKPNKPRPWQIKWKKFICECCGIEFEDKPASNRRFCSLSCVAKSIDKSYMQTESYRNTLIRDTTPEYRRYRNRVSRLTEKTYQENIDILNPNRYIRTLCGIEDGWQLDHIVSVQEGFKNGLTPEELSVKENLQMLPWKDNLLKR